MLELKLNNGDTIITDDENNTVTRIYSLDLTDANGKKIDIKTIKDNINVNNVITE